MNFPFVFRASNQLNSAVLAPPTCNEPVGDGANLTRTGAIVSISMTTRNRAKLLPIPLILKACTLANNIIETQNLRNFEKYIYTNNLVDYIPVRIQTPTLALGRIFMVRHALLSESINCVWSNGIVKG